MIPIVVIKNYNNYNNSIARFERIFPYCIIIIDINDDDKKNQINIQQYIYIHFKRYDSMFMLMNLQWFILPIKFIIGICFFFF